MKHYYVYIHTNLKNGKVYVGTTQQEHPEIRWRKNGHGYSGNEHFWNAIQKYGWENFSHEFWEVDSTEEMWAQEISLIALYDSTNPNKGYNRSTGGEQSHYGCHLSDEQRDLASKITEALWQDPEYRANVIAAQRKAWEDPSLHAYVSEATKAAMDTPELRAYLSQLARVRCEDQEYRAHMCEVSKTLWEDPEFRAHMSEVHKRENLSDETIQKMRDAKKDIPLSEEHKANIRKNAEVNPNFGMKNKHHSEDTKKVLSTKSRENAEVNPNYGMKNKHHSKESNEKNRQSHLGKVPWNKGKKLVTGLDGKKHWYTLEQIEEMGKQLC